MTAGEHIGYAEALAGKRRLQRQRIHERVLHPIDTPSLLRDPLARPSSPIGGTVAMAKLTVAALAIHGVSILVLYAISELLGVHHVAPKREVMTVQVVETEAAPDLESVPVASDFLPKPVDSEVEPTTKPEPKTKVEPKPKPKPKDRPVRRKPVVKPEPSAAPDDQGNETPDNQPVRRRRLGVSFDSTVDDGAGPKLATGDSRMGQTETEAQAPTRSPSQADGTGTRGRGSRKGSSQRAASAIPTRDTAFDKPKRLSPSNPPYPKTLKAQGIEADVKVRVSLDAEGRVRNVAILASSGHKAFDDAARKAARKERFEPARRAGTAVPFTLSYSYRFRIQEK